MKTLLINFLCIFFSCNTDKYENMDLKEGLYYGRNKGFFPQSIVYATIRKDTVYVECYLPLKGEFFLILIDTLILKDQADTLYSSEKSTIYSGKGKLFFKTITGKSEYNVEETQITYQPEKENEYIEIKNKSKPFNE